MSLQQLHFSEAYDVSIYNYRVIVTVTADKYNFDKYSELMSDTPPEPYDPWSVMHYTSFHFSKNGLPTMTTLEGEILGTQVSTLFS